MKKIILLALTLFSNQLLWAQNSTTFLVLGDWGRGGEPNQAAVARQMAKTASENNAAFVVSTGDNFYSNGVADVNDPQWRTSFEDVYNQPSLDIPWYVVLGNHDHKTNADAEIAYTSKSKRWYMPARYYSLKLPFDKTDTTKKMLLVFLDSSPFSAKYYNDKEYKMKLNGEDTVAEKTWLIRVLQDADTNIKWRFVFAHHPLYTSGKRVVDAETYGMRGSLKPIFDKYHVDAYITGHEHHLECIKPEGRTWYFISGAGSEIRPVEKKIPESKFPVSDHGFMMFTVGESELKESTINSSGSILDTETVKK